MKQKPYRQLTEADFPPGEPVLKSKRGLWYRDNNSGYTDRVAEAGFYPREEAIKYCFSRYKDGPLKNGSCDVFAVPIRMAVASVGYTTSDIDKKLAKLTELRKFVPESEESGVVIF